MQFRLVAAGALQVRSKLLAAELLYLRIPLAIEMLLCACLGVRRRWTGPSPTTLRDSPQPGAPVWSLRPVGFTYVRSLPGYRRGASVPLDVPPANSEVRLSRGPCRDCLQTAGAAVSLDSVRCNSFCSAFARSSPAPTATAGCRGFFTYLVRFCGRSRSR